MKQVDVTIVGHGVVGLALALQLAKANFTVALLGDHAPSQVAKALSSQVYAMHLGSERLLRELDVWSDNTLHATAFYRMEAWDAQTGSALHIDAHEAQLSHLGHFVAVPALRERLWQAVNAHPGIDVVCPAQTQSLQSTSESVQLKHTKGTMHSKLLVAADGSSSWVRAQCPIEMEQWTCDQIAMTAIVASEQAHKQTARQAFLKSGPLGLLPVDKDRLQVMVWSLDADRVEEVLALDEVNFNERLTQALGSRLGHMTLQSPRHHFPLRTQHAKSYAHDRVVLVGDAAHSIHPLAGQGANLGLMDTCELTAVLDQARRAGLPLHDARVLSRYQRTRHSANQRMLLTCLGLQRCFAQSAWPWQWLRSVGIEGLQRLPWGKHALMREALGQ